MNKPAVSIVIPVYNAGTYLAEALASVLSQTFINWHLTILDDGSTDTSMQIAHRFAAVDQRITVREDGQNRGLVYRLNQMVSLSDAPLIARMDADDIMHPDRLARQVETFIARPELDVLGSAAYALDHRSEPYGFKAALPIPATPAGFLTSSPLIHPSVMYRREWLLQHRYDAQYERAEDYALWWTAHTTSTMDNLYEPLLYYRERGLPYRGKYRRSSEAYRRLLRLVGQQPEWRAQTIRAIVVSHLKDLAYDVAALLGREQVLIERRSRHLTARERLDAQLGLRTIQTRAAAVLTSTSGN